MTSAKANLVQYSERSTPDSLHKVNLTRLVNSTALAKAFVTRGCTLQGIVTPERNYAHTIRLAYNKSTKYILLQSKNKSFECYNSLTDKETFFKEYDPNEGRYKTIFF